MSEITLFCTAAITEMNSVYQHCLLKCRNLANAESLYTWTQRNRLMPDVSQSIADQLLYVSAIEMVIPAFCSVCLQVVIYSRPNQ